VNTFFFFFKFDFNCSLLEMGREKLNNFLSIVSDHVAFNFEGSYCTI